MGGSIIHERKPAKWLTFILAFTKERLQGPRFGPFGAFDFSTRIKLSISKLQLLQTILQDDVLEKC